MKKSLLLLCFALVSFSFQAYSQCAALFEVQGESYTVFCAVSGSAQFSITVSALGNDSLTLNNVVSLGDSYKAELFCATDSFYIFRQVSNGREIEANGRRVSSIVSLNITEYDTATGSVIQSCSGTYSAPPVSVDPALEQNLPISIAPNPVHDRAQAILSEEIIDPSQLGLRILNLNGATVQNISNLPGQRFEMDLSDLSPGLYFFQLWEGKQLRQSGKLLHQ